MEDVRCLHVDTLASMVPGTMRRHGVMWIEQVWCTDCQARVSIRTFEDERDDHGRLLPPDGPATAQLRKEP